MEANTKESHFEIIAEKVAGSNDDLDLLNFGQFIRTYGKHDLLTREQETILGRQVQKGLTVEDEVKQLGVATKEQQFVIDQGIFARKKFFDNNIRLVLNLVVKKYDADPAARNSGRMNLLQEGLEGMDYAITKFDPEKGFKFSTYATWWIKQKMQRTVQNTSKGVRLPVHIEQQLAKLRKNTDKSDAEIKEIMGIDQEKLDWLRRSERINETMLSIDGKIDPDSDSTYAQFIPAKENVETEILEIARDDAFVGLLGRLLYLHRRVIEMRFGLSGNEPHTLNEVGRQIGMPREKVRKIEKKALAELQRIALGLDREVFEFD